MSYFAELVNCRRLHAGSEGARDAHGYGAPHGCGVLFGLLRADAETCLPDATVVLVLPRVLQGWCGHHGVSTIAHHMQSRTFCSAAHE